MAKTLDVTSPASATDHALARREPRTIDPVEHRARIEPLATAVDLSVIIPALHEGENLSIILPQLVDVLTALCISYEILIVTRDADAPTHAAAATVEARVIEQVERGYGGALVAGFAESRGDYVLTMDADASHAPGFVENLWKSRRNAELTIASRYVRGGRAHMPFIRHVLSRVLNTFFSLGLDVPIRDVSSGFRLYKGAVLREQRYSARDFDILQQIVIRAYADGWHVQEIPFTYEPRGYGSSHARVLRVGRACLATFWQLWRLRNSILAADYDDRAHDSRIPLQRYWQRMRFRYVTELVAGQGPVLDVGCGSSRIIGALPRDSVAVDILRRKLRYARRFNRRLVHASGFSLPFADAAFPCVLCSQVIEHVPKDSPILDELCRVLAPGGRLVLGTPDYDHWEWVAIEKVYGMVPGGYADEHIAHYSYDELKHLIEARGFTLEDARYILRGELIMAFRKPRSGSSAARTSL
jgi:dolichol-phosphate mannosyltransferase